MDPGGFVKRLAISVEQGPSALLARASVRWLAVLLGVLSVWLAGLTVEARADVSTDASGTIVATTDASTAETVSTGSGDGLTGTGTATGGTTDATGSSDLSAVDGAATGDGAVTTDPSTVTDPAVGSTGTGSDPAPATEPTDPAPTTDPITDPAPTDPTATSPSTEPTPTPDPAPPPPDPASTDPTAIAPGTEPTPDPTTPVADPGTPTDTLPAPSPTPVIPDPVPVPPGQTHSIVEIGGTQPEPLSPVLEPSALDVLSGIAPAVPSREDDSSPRNGPQPSTPKAPSAPLFPTPHSPSAPANPAPGGVGGGFGPSPLGVLAALVALLTFAGVLGGVLPVSMSALRPADFAFHLKRPG